VIFHSSRHAIKGIHSQFDVNFTLFDRGATSSIGPQVFKKKCVQSQMHSLEEGVDVKGIQKVFHGYGDVLECKPQVPKFEKAKQGL
jgi:hypothetical protein